MTTPTPSSASAPTIADRIRTLAERRDALGRPLVYEHLPAILDGSRLPSSLDIALIATEADVLVELLLGTRPRRAVLTYADLWMLR
ncbi:transporter [Streptomyces sp. NPDC048219]|uniref:Uncharacterized protein n=1 Tax=Streptomyces zinciresistens K42 TaxID=700597 RepID=G2GA04_9ACTN|nr:MULTISPECIES: hypothetical protein [Streptomyces]EGX59715.1 hypothetical protein SZN_11623 [Streptomyces zinciresistens K42]